MKHALPCKPAHPGVVYKKFVHELKATIRFRSLDLDNDIPLINTWVNQAYAKKFWQLDGQGNNLRTIYQAVLDNPSAHSFMGMIDDQPFCQIDAYSIMIDELHEHIDAKENDAGFHILLCPPREMQKGWSHYAIRCFQEYFFSIDSSGDLYAEPDQSNYHANRLAINTGMRFLKTITLSYKTANLYLISRPQ